MSVYFVGEKFFLSNTTFKSIFKILRSISATEISVNILATTLPMIFKYLLFIGFILCFQMKNRSCLFCVFCYFSRVRNRENSFFLFLLHFVIRHNNNSDFYCFISTFFLLSSTIYRFQVIFLFEYLHSRLKIYQSLFPYFFFNRSVGKFSQ